MHYKVNKVLHDVVGSHDLYQLSMWFARHGAIIHFIKTQQGYFQCILCDISLPAGLSL